VKAAQKNAVKSILETLLTALLDKIERRLSLFVDVAVSA
jgi:hypothetical protein